ncbi:MAG TPA: TonB-dependent receptor [Bacteroidales bacterium]|nr:TonB-dependent receptor [Bacteroidales bacterium]HPS17316.1 TonB-dependent receptor [Bacteroidales bacterium]
MKIKIIKYFFLFFLIVSVFEAYSQVSINGKITDASSNEELEGATISIKELNISAISNNSGNYEFSSIPAGSYNLKVKLMGYKDTSLYITTSAGAYNFNFKLISGMYEMNSVIVTATRTEKKIKDLPASVGIITRDEIQEIPAVTADEYLSLISGINITRHFGIFYKTGDVTMRGLNRNVYTLLLIDGIPASIVDGGATNWNRINPENIRKIEVIKGPNSSLYGSNAMGGVINVITRHPSKPFKAEVNTFYGTYNTYGGSLNLSGSKIKNDKGFYWLADGFIRRSDGYVLYPDSIAESTDVATYLKENNGSLRTGYSFNKNNNLEIEYDASDATMGQGKKIFEELGNYYHDIYQFWQARYNGLIGKFRIYASAFYKYDFDDAQKESIKQSGAYTFLNTYTDSGDKGIWCNASFPFKKNQTITFGFDSKLGKTKSSDVYHTSTDTVTYKGNLDYYGLFAQDDIEIIKNRLKSIIGLRYDIVNFFDADFTIDAPSFTTSFMLPYLQPLTEKNWNALSPKAGLLYKYNDSLSVYFNVSRGFRSGTLSDMCKTGDVNKGFKLANPYLKPEYLSNAEIGMVIQYHKLEVEPVLFYSIGKDFQYFVGTGDSIYTTKTKKQPVIKRENISKVEIYGIEFAANYTLNKHLSAFLNYSYNHSQIKDFDTTLFVSKDLTNKFLIDVPLHHIFSGIIYKSKFINFSIIYKYASSTWADDENTIKVDDYALFDAKVSKKFFKSFNASLTCENIFNTIHLDSKGLLPPGRFFIASLGYSF